MHQRLALGGVLGLLVWPGVAEAAHAGAPLEVPFWTILPFLGLLAAIAVLPLVAGQFWHANRNRALVAALFAVPIAAYLVGFDFRGRQAGLHALAEGLKDYVSFIFLLGALYIVAGGIVVDLQARPGPVVNGAVLATGAILANLIGTTGASMVLLPPFLRLNRNRRNTGHLPLFFIFLVGNMGGLLTPLGDPPLFLGFLDGVGFFWTLGLWPQWLLGNGLVLAIFLVWDSAAFRAESATAAPPSEEPRFKIRGRFNLVFMTGIVAAVLLQSEQVSRRLHPDLNVRWPWPEAVIGLMALLSLLLTPKTMRQANAFAWGPILEVAILFAGIFVTMVPALELLRAHGAALGVTAPWQLYLGTGVLSAFLDNAPTYLTFATTAAQGQPLSALMSQDPRILAAISCGAVFMGALTYIGNGPNFMIKALAEEAGYPMPSFGGYLARALLILGPVLLLIMLLFFPPWA
jgi:Na+/H+ antiporter NhaD/arsenite permease-like protein